MIYKLFKRLHIAILRHDIKEWDKIMQRCTLEEFAIIAVEQNERKNKLELLCKTI